MNDLLQLFKENIKREKLFHVEDILLIAVSGGIDSIALCELCWQSGFQFIIAHCNFQLRGAESERDEHFVKALSERYGVQVLVKHFDTEEYVLKNKISVQLAARELRYKWFHELAVLLRAKTNLPVYILTAHHADDNIETVLMNLFKGTGIAGMRGMLPKKGKIVRPLLFVKKEKLISFVKDRRLSFVEDTSNSSDKYSRNYLRNLVIPSIQKIYPEADRNIAASIDRFREVELLYKMSVDIYKKNLVEPRGNEIYISVNKLLKTVPLKTIVFEIIKAYGFTAKQTEEVITLLHAETGKFILSSDYRILRNRNWLIISALPPNTTDIIIISEEEKEVIFRKGKLNIDIRPKRDDSNEIPASSAVAYLDMKQVIFPLILRKWKHGDYFYPLGMQKKKKLSRFFIDQKMSLPEKEGAWVIEMNKRIIWIVNHRIDDRFKISRTTQSVLEIRFTSN